MASLLPFSKNFISGNQCVNDKPPLVDEGSLFGDFAKVQLPCVDTRKSLGQRASQLEKEVTTDFNQHHFFTLHLASSVKSPTSLPSSTYFAEDSSIEDTTLSTPTTVKPVVQLPPILTELDQRNVRMINKVEFSCSLPFDQNKRFPHTCDSKPEQKGSIIRHKDLIPYQVALAEHPRIPTNRESNLLTL